MSDTPKRLLARLTVLLVTVSTVPLGLAVNPTVAHAQDDATVEIARQRFREGVQHYDKREYEKARLAFLQAYALKPHPAVLLNLAQSELRANYPADAANHFALYLRENPDATEAERQEAELGFAASKSKAGAVEIAVDQEGADVFVDGEKIGRSPMDGPVYVTPGKHTVSAQSGNKNASSEVLVDAGESTGATLRLAGAPPPPSTAATPPPPSTAEDPHGSELDFQADTGGGRQDFFEWFAETPAAWVGAGLAVVGAGAGTVFAISAKNSYDVADQRRSDIQTAKAQDEARERSLAENEGRDPRPFPAAPCELDVTSASSYGIPGGRLNAYQEACADFINNRDEGDNFRLGAIVSYSVAGAAAVGTIIYYFVDADAEETAESQRGLRARVVPVLGPDLNGLSISGAF